MGHRGRATSARWHLAFVVAAGVVALVGAVVASRAPGALVWVAAWVVVAHTMLLSPAAVAVDRAGQAVGGGVGRAAAAAGRWVGRSVGWIVGQVAAEAGRIRRSVASHRQLAWACAIGGLGTMALIGPSMWRMAHGRANGYLANDWLPFIQAVDETRFWPLRLTTPHFMYSTTGAVVQRLTQTTPATATALVGIGSVGITGGVLVWFFHRLWNGRGAALPLAGCVAATWAFVVADLPQVLFFRKEALTFDRLNVSVHQWNTPSSLGVEWMQLLLLIAVAQLGRDTPPGRRWVVWVAVLTVVTTLMLPGMPMALAVGTPVWLWRSGQLDRWRLFAVAFVAPLGFALAMEALESVLWLKPGWNPPLQFELGGSLNRLELWGPGLGVLVPVALVALLGWRAFCEPAEVRLTGWALCGGLLLLLTLSLGGPREQEGNIGRVTFAVSWVAYLLMVRWVLELARGWRAWRTWPWRRRAAAPLVVVYVALSVAAGAAMLLEQSGLITFTGASI